MRYKLQTGSFAWLIHRITGIALTLYIFAHIYILSHLKDPEEFNALMGLMRNPLVRLGEIGLLALAVSHALNGIRLTLIDIGVTSRHQKTMFAVAAIIGGLIVIAGAIPLVGGDR